MPLIPVLDGIPVELPRVLSTASAARLGISRAALRHRVDRHGWQVIARGLVLTASDGPTRHDWALAGLELAGPRAAISGWDALRTVGLGAVEPPPPCPVLVLDRAGRHRVIGGVRIRPTDRPYAIRLLPAEHPTLAHVPVAGTARAVADAALTYRTLPPVRALVTSAIQRRRCTVAALAAELAAAPRRDSAMLRRALEDVLDGAWSIAEAEAVDLLRPARVPSFELNVPILDTSGVLVATVDLLWRELRAAVEIDSVEFHFGEDAWKGTGRRHNLLTTGGLALEHFPPSEIRTRRAAWARDVEAWLRGRAAELGVAYVVGDGPVRSGGSGPPPFVLPRPASSR